MRATSLATQTPRVKRYFAGMGGPDQLALVSDSIPASVGGWDTLSPIADMPPDHAVVLDNWIPRPGYLEIRRGTQSWASGMGAAVQTIMGYNAGSTGNDKLFAVAGTTIWDITAGGVAAATTVTTLSTSAVQYTNFTDTAGNHYLIVVNGLDTERKYDGSTWSALGITGFTAGTIVSVLVHKGRLWFVPDSSTKAYYLNPVGAIAGAATSFEYGMFMTKGGSIKALATWSIDTKQTVDDYFAIITTKGQVIVYQGTDPSSASTWALVGVYDVGAPIGRRCFLRVAGDLFIICVDGILPMSQMLSTDRAAANRVSLTAQIMDTMRQSAALYGSNFGWQFIAYPAGTLAILNIPTATNSTAVQYVMNTLTGAWCQFTGINANCWELYHDVLYLGRNDGTVYQFDVDSADGSTAITATVNSAFNYFKSRGRRKRFTAVRPIITTQYTVTPGVGINTDFGTNGVATSPAFGAVSGSQWDVALWDVGVWPPNSSVSNNWLTLTGEGYCGSIITQVTTMATGQSTGVLLRLNGFDVAMEVGGIL